MVLLPIAGWLFWPLGNPFRGGYSRVVYDCNGELLRATLAPDRQLRFPPTKGELPKRYVAAVLASEDRRFYWHFGVDPLAIGRALVANLRAGKIVQGGSTITMQVVRLSHPRRRTFFVKAIECLQAIRLTLHMSKKELLRIYASHVPMGGNTVGIESAAYRYYGKPMADLTWAEAALLAVLPNSPSSINIERGREELRRKRDKLLHILLRRRKIDSLTYVLAIQEELPPEGSRLPFHAPHFCEYALRSLTGTTLTTSLDLTIQRRVEEVVKNAMWKLSRQGIRNCAVLVAEASSGLVRAYVGSQSYNDNAAQGKVDGVQAMRSTGSLFKPFLVAKAIERGPFCMQSMLHDIPTYYGTFAPQNFSQEFTGITTVEQMLIQSLNVPAVRLLHYYGVDDFYTFLKNQAGLSRLFRSSEGYGLSLILGGAEASLWELCRLYATLGNYGHKVMLRLTSEGTTPLEPKKTKKGQAATTSAGFSWTTTPIFSEGASWLVLQTLHELKRPDAEYYWQYFSDKVPVAWKTGTSYGQKDAWAIGVNAQWVIGVWVGNFDGEGNAMLGGAQSAGPILFTLFRDLSDRRRNLWFEKPEFDLRTIEVCEKSGFTPTAACLRRISVLIPAKSFTPRLCPIHRRYCLSRTRGFEVCSRCWDVNDTLWQSRAIYDPAAATIMRLRGHIIDESPRHNPSCPTVQYESSVKIEYPVQGIDVQVPRDFSGEYQRVVFSANYSRHDGRLFWFLNNVLLGETVGIHRLAVDLKQGNHRLVVQDEDGARDEVEFRAFRTY